MDSGIGRISLFCQLEGLNAKIAQEGLTHKDTIKYILSQQALMPTVCLDVKQLSEIYSLDEARAEGKQEGLIKGQW